MALSRNAPTNSGRSTRRCPLQNSGALATSTIALATRMTIPRSRAHPERPSGDTLRRPWRPFVCVTREWGPILPGVKFYARLGYCAQSCESRYGEAQLDREQQKHSALLGGLYCLILVDAIASSTT